MSQPMKRMNVFERYLSLWVAVCMVLGVAIGKLAPGVVGAMRDMEFGTGSHINIPIAILIWLMIYPMMLKIDFASLKGVGKRPGGLVVTLVVNWLVKPFSMAFLGWFFFRHVFTPWIGPELASEYIAGVIILAAAPCTAMVFVWSYLADGDPAYTLVQVAVNDLIMLVAFAPVVKFLVSGASGLQVPFAVLLYSVFIFVVIPLAAGSISRSVLIRRKGVGVVHRALPPVLPARDRDRAPPDARRHLRLPGGEHHDPRLPRRADRDPDPHPGLLQLRPLLRAHEGLPHPVPRRRPRRPHRRLELLRAGGGHRHRPLRPGLRRRPRHRGGGARRGAGHALRLSLLRRDARLVRARRGDRSLRAPSLEPGFLMSERWKLVLLVGVFASPSSCPSRARACGRPPGASSCSKAPRQHVILCLVPAFFIAGDRPVREPGAVLRYLGAGPAAGRVRRRLRSGSILAVVFCGPCCRSSPRSTAGAGLGPATALLYSGPAINVLAMILTARVLGLQLGLARAIGAVLFAVVVGVLMALSSAGRRPSGNDRRRPLRRRRGPASPRQPWQDALFLGTMVAILVFANWGASNEAVGFFAGVYRVHWPLTAALRAALDG